MAGHMGDEQITVKKLTSCGWMPSATSSWFGGAVPGARNGAAVSLQKAK